MTGSGTSAATTLKWLTGARIQRVDLPEAGLLCLSLYHARTRYALLLRFGAAGGAGLVAERPRGEQAGPLAQKLRKKLVGAALSDARWLGDPHGAARGLSLGLQGRASELIAWWRRGESNLVCVDDRDRAIIAANVAGLRQLGGALGAAPPRWPDAAEPPFEDSAEAWTHAGERLLRAATRDDATTAREAEARRQRAARRKLERKVRAIRGDLALAERAIALREDAKWLLCHLDAVPAGASEARLPPREPGGPPVRVALSPHLNAQQNAERIFHEARRRERGRSIAETRLRETLAELDALAREPDGPPQGPTPTSASPGPRPTKGPSAAKAGQSRRKPYRRFLAEGDRTVLVGRSAAENDILTVQIARPHDLWLHVREGAGSHVVVPQDRGAECPGPLRIDAALLAAHFSAARGEPLVDVMVAERRHVHKRRGAAPGSVRVQREKVLRLRTDPARLQWLLSRERPGG